MPLGENSAQRRQHPMLIPGLSLRCRIQQHPLRQTDSITTTCADIGQLHAITHTAIQRLPENVSQSVEILPEKQAANTASVMPAIRPARSGKIPDHPDSSPFVVGKINKSIGNHGHRTLRTERPAPCGDEPL